MFKASKTERYSQNFKILFLNYKQLILNSPSYFHEKATPVKLITCQ